MRGQAASMCSTGVAGGRVGAGRGAPWVAATTMALPAGFAPPEKPWAAICALKKSPWGSEITQSWSQR